MAFRQVLSSCGVIDLSTTVREAGKRYVAFTSYVDSKCALQFSVTDGLRTWSKDFDEVALQKCREASAVATLDAYLADIKSTFQSGQPKLSVLPQQTNLILPPDIEFELNESTVHVSKQLIQDLVIALATKADNLSTELVATKRKLEQRQKDAVPDMSSTSAALYEPELKKKNPGPKMKRQQGRSLLNPSSRKRKAASGVVFDEE